MFWSEEPGRRVIAAVQSLLGTFRGSGEVDTGASADLEAVVATATPHEVYLFAAIAAAAIRFASEHTGR